MNLQTLSFLVLLLITSVANAKTEPVEIQGAIGTLRGVIATPDHLEGKKIPTVIIFHGFTGNIDEKIHIALAESLLKQGIASVRFDFNGHGKSDGEFKKMSIDNELEDARRIVAFTEGLPFVSKIGIVGHSQGGVISVLLSAELGKGKIKTVALLAPAIVLHDNMLQGNFFGTTFDPVNIPDEVQLFGGKLTVGKDYILAGQRIKPFEAARKYKGKVKIIHGTADTAVPYSYGEYLTYFYKKSDLTVLEKVDHTFTNHENTVAQEVAHWVKKELK